VAELSPASLVIRPARAGDRDDMLRITRRVWDGTDYVPFRWQRWLNDSSGFLCVAVWNGRVVGLQHTSVQPDGTAWMEGIRVDETMRSRGVGAAMLQHGLSWARNAGCSVARLSTSSENQSSVRIALKAGLREVARFDVLAGPASPAPEPGPPVRLAHPGDLEALKLKLLQEWNTDETNSFCTEGWNAYQLTAERIDLLVAVHAIAVVAQDGIDAVGIATAPVGSPILRLGYLRGRIEGKKSIVTWMQQRAHAASIEQIRAILPADPTTEAALLSLGLTPRADFAMILWEIQL
jgi:GNAT superfamily N-acetyltransferase